MNDFKLRFDQIWIPFFYLFMVLTSPITYIAGQVLRFYWFLSPYLIKNKKSARNS